MSPAAAFTSQALLLKALDAGASAVSTSLLEDPGNHKTQDARMDPALQICCSGEGFLKPGFNRRRFTLFTLFFSCFLEPSGPSNPEVSGA